MAEIWKDVVGFECYYLVSSHGRVKSLPRNVQRGKSVLPIKGRILAPVTIKITDNYSSIAVGLSKCGITRHYRIARLVLDAFIGPPGPGQECCHNDGDPSNNHVDNLRCDTKSANQNDRAKHGTSNRGERQWQSKFTVDDVFKMRELRSQGWPYTKIGKMFNTGRAHARSICIKEKWAHV